jgi:sec-independent protein translocase protein TatB
MFGIDWQELLVIVFVAVLLIGPKDLPRAMRTAGRWMGKVRRTSNHFRAGIEAMIREAEMEEMEKKWAEQNAKIMAEHPGQPDLGEHEMRPLPRADADGRAVPPPASAEDEEPQLPLPKRPPG